MPLKACSNCGKPSPNRRCDECQLPERTMTPSRRIAILNRDGWRCRDPEHRPDRTRELVDQPYLPNSAHVGHRISRVDAVGTAHAARIDDDANLYASCSECNLRRGSRSEGD